MVSAGGGAGLDQPADAGGGRIRASPAGGAGAPADGGLCALGGSGAHRRLQTRRGPGSRPGDRRPRRAARVSHATGRGAGAVCRLGRAAVSPCRGSLKMAAANSVGPLRRLFGLLRIEEQQARRSLQAAAAELQRLERRGRALIAAGAAGRRQDYGAVLDRIAGLEEIRLGRQASAELAPRIVAAQSAEAALREAYLAKRVERRQVETLLRAAEIRKAREAAKREQQALDDWFLGGRLRARRSRPDAGKTQPGSRDDKWPEDSNPGPVSES